jgi:hypothetical protein
MNWRDKQNIDEEKEARTANRRLAKKRVQCLIEALCFVSSSVLSDSLCFEIRFFAKCQNVRLSNNPPFQQVN